MVLPFRAGLFVSVGMLEELEPEEYEPVGSDPKEFDPEDSENNLKEFDLEETKPRESEIHPVLRSRWTPAAAITWSDHFFNNGDRLRWIQDHTHRMLFLRGTPQVRLLLTYGQIYRRIYTLCHREYRLFCSTRAKDSLHGRAE